MHLWQVEYKIEWAGGMMTVAAETAEEARRIARDDFTGLGWVDIDTDITERLPGVLPEDFVPGIVYRYSWDVH